MYTTIESKNIGIKCVAYCKHINKNFYTHPADLSKFYAPLHDLCYSTPLILLIDGTEFLCIIKEIQLSVMEKKPIHVDFLIIKYKDEKNDYEAHSFHTKLPIHIVNAQICEAIKAGAIIKQPVRTVSVIKTLSSPNRIDVNIENLRKGQSIGTHSLVIEGIKFLKRETIVLLK